MSRSVVVRPKSHYSSKMFPNKAYRWADFLLQLGVLSAFCGAYLSVSLIGAGVLLSLLAWLFLLWSPSSRASLFQHPLFYPVLILALAIILSIVFAKPYPFQKPLEKVGYLLALFPFTLMFKEHPERKRFVLRSCFVFSFLLTLVALGQFLGLFQDWGSFLTHHSKPLENSRHHYYLATGLTFHHTPFAATMTWAFHVLLAHSFFCSSRKKRGWLRLAAALCIVCVLTSLSRGVWLALFFSTCFSVALINWKKLLPLLLGGGVVFSILFFFVPEFQHRINSIRLAENPERIKLWSISLRMFKDSPIFGQGYHSFSSRLDSFAEAGELYASFPKEAHNMYLDFLATTGIVGLISFLFLAFMVIKNLLQSWQKRDLSSLERPWILAALGGFSSFLIAGFFDRHFYMSQTLVPNLTLLAIAFSICIYPKIEYTASH